MGLGVHGSLVGGQTLLGQKTSRVSPEDDVGISGPVWGLEDV